MSDDSSEPDTPIAWARHTLSIGDDLTVSDGVGCGLTMGELRDVIGALDYLGSEVDKARAELDAIKRLARAARQAEVTESGAMVARNALWAALGVLEGDSDE